MEKTLEDVKTELTENQIHELDERRIDQLDKNDIDEDEVLGDARNNLNDWNNYFNENVTRGKDDVNFVIRDQWSAVERSEFTRLQKPAMTFNKLLNPVNQILGEQRKNKPDFLIRSLNGIATEEQIDLRASLLRTICYQSQTDLVVQAAARSALMLGFGACEIGIEYESSTSFNKVLRFMLVTDATRTAFDPKAILPHKGDGNFCSRQYIYSKKEFEATYPYISDPVSYIDPRMMLDFQWETRDTIVVAKYTRKEWYSTMIYKLSNGMTVTQEEWEEMQKNFSLYKNLAKDSKVVDRLIMDELPKVVMERQTENYKVRQYTLTQNRIIDFCDFPSKYLPIIFFDGNSDFIEGRQYTKSFIHEARDAQKCVNYIGSEVIAEIKNRRREQWMATPDNIVGQEQMWRNPEAQMGVLIAKPDPKTSQMPQKMPPWDLSPAMLQQFQRCTMDIREITGFNESMMGQEDNAQSGVAIANRQLVASMCSYVFDDNRNQAWEQAGRVCLDLLPYVYGGDERNAIITLKDGKTKNIILNQRNTDGSVINEIEPGEYDIELDTGASFAIQKQAALEFLQKTMQVSPQSFNLIADLWAKNLDVQFMPQMAERFRTLVPPDILAKEDGEPPPPPQPNPQAEMMEIQKQMAIQQLKERAQELTLKQQQQELEKMRLILEAVEMKEKMNTSLADHALDLHKTELDHSAKLTKIISDLHKPSKHEGEINKHM